LEHNQSTIREIKIDGQAIEFESLKPKAALIGREKIEALAPNQVHTILVELEKRRP